MTLNNVEYLYRNYSKTQLYWIFQACGWFVYSTTFIWDNVFFNHEDFTATLDTAITFTLFGFTGFLLSLVLRAIYQKLEQKNFFAFLTIAFISCNVLALLWTVSKKLYIWYFLYPDVYTKWINNDIPFSAIFLYYSSSLLVFLVWSAFYSGVNFHIKSIEQNKRILKIQADHDKAKLELLRYQLNPHFLFNSLNAASNLAMRGDGEKTSDMLAKLATFLRFSLDNSPTDRVTLQQDLSVMEKYLEIESIRFGDRLKVVWQVDPNSLQTLVPNFLIQPLIENVIKHALNTSKSQSVLTITAQLNNSHLYLSVSDNGPLTSLDAIHSSKGIGLSNIKQRLELFYCHDYQLNMNINEPHGLNVEIVIPTDIKKP
ncbi:sensor histidine kinase [Thalassotalea hakodatensis]|uniref:sensor histidine kinase n=1 Tax=Thalassotalea hakodatensis TaxID=3030492 RepID=UPI002572687C|nr:histidine kinase [Thalassotalea hakodatensis]